MQTTQFCKIQHNKFVFLFNQNLNKEFYLNFIQVIFNVKKEPCFTNSNQQVTINLEKNTFCSPIYKFLKPMVFIRFHT